MIDPWGRTVSCRPRCAHMTWCGSGDAALYASMPGVSDTCPWPPVYECERGARAGALKHGVSAGVEAAWGRRIKRPDSVTPSDVPRRKRAATDAVERS